MASETSTKSRNTLVLLISVFYFIAGIAVLGLFAMESASAPIHLLILGIVSLVTGYSVYAMKKWSTILVVGTLGMGLTFGAVNLSTALAIDAGMLFTVAMVGYMILLVIASLFALAQRENFN
ncbi:MAG: hypothetical protein NWF03_07945 [Candidatus Bathyarchaeota archaeon]|nr:hypothetical protein [Candidatus Bathyarchaeota archaeon]